MKVYFDIENMESFLKSKYKDFKKYSLCNEMLKKYLDMQINISPEDFLQNEDLMNWAKELQEDGAKLPQLLSERFVQTPSLESRGNTESLNNALYSLESGFESIYCINCDSAAEIDSKGNFMITTVGGELELLYSLVIDSDDPYTHDLDLPEEFSKGTWDSFSKYALPCTDVIIADSYMLSVKRMYDSNIYAFLENITSKLYDTKVNIFLCSLQKQKHKDKKTGEEVEIEPEWSTIRKEIKDRLAQFEIDAYISFISPEKTEDFGQHDRTAFTNFRSYIPGSTLNFFNNDELTTRGLYFHVHNLVKTNHYKKSRLFINQIQGVIDGIKSGAKNGMLDIDPALTDSPYLRF